MRSKARSGMEARPSPRAAPLGKVDLDREATPSGPESPVLEADAGGPATKSVPPNVAWSEDWSDPSKLRKMNPLWPLAWISIPLVIAIVWGLIATKLGM